jgi:hypothetical protein
MPFTQSGPGATANIGTYNDAAGNQTINTNTNSYNQTVGDITSTHSRSVHLAHLVTFLLQLGLVVKAVKEERAVKKRMFMEGLRQVAPEGMAEA